MQKNTVVVEAAKYGYHWKLVLELLLQSTSSLEGKLTSITQGST
jgi:hypothetical protein